MRNLRFALRNGVRSNLMKGKPVHASDNLISAYHFCELLSIYEELHLIDATFCKISSIGIDFINLCYNDFFNNNYFRKIQFLEQVNYNHAKRQFLLTFLRGNGSPISSAGKFYVYLCLNFKPLGVVQKKRPFFTAIFPLKTVKFQGILCYFSDFLCRLSF